jgi:DUF971 family protein
MDRESPQPTEIKLHQKSRVLEITFADGKSYRLPVRVPESPFAFRGSARPRAGAGSAADGKKEVDITRVEPVGSYALQLCFSDGHDTGIYSWDLLHQYGAQQETMWRQYLERMEQAGASREPGPAPFGERPKAK